MMSRVLFRRTRLLLALDLQETSIVGGRLVGVGRAERWLLVEKQLATFRLWARRIQGLQVHCHESVRTFVFRDQCNTEHSPECIGSRLCSLVLVLFVLLCWRRADPTR